MEDINEEKIRSGVETCLEKGIDIFVIYPYGKKGKLVKKVLNQFYGIKELAIVDNQLAKSDKRFWNMDDLERIDKNYVILLSSDNRKIWNEIREELKGKLIGEVFDLAEEETEPEIAFNLIGKSMNIDYCNVEQLKYIFEKTKESWKELGEKEPYWSVVTHNEFKMQNCNEKEIRKFYSMGRLHVAKIVSVLIRNQKVRDWEELKKLSITEIGCGCGRVTKHLADCFGKVVATDISAGNLEIARKQIVKDNVDFQLLKQLEDYNNLAETDVVYSYLVLQHNCPPIIEYMIHVILRLVKVDGFAIFQVPTYRRDYYFDYRSYMENDSKGIEMHLLPQSKIFQIAYDRQCIPLEVYPVFSTGQEDNSTYFIFRKMASYGTN